MSTSTYYNFISANATADRNKRSATVVEAASQIDIQRHKTASPSSITTSSSNSSSSLNGHFISLIPSSQVVASAKTYSSSSFSSSSSSSASSTSSNTNLKTPNGQMTTTPLGGGVTTRSLACNQQRDLIRQASVTPTQLSGQNYSPHHSYTLHSLEPKPLKPFKSQSAYIEAMKEDLAEWLNSIYSDLDLTPENFFTQLETGAIICRHANNVTQMGRNLMIEQTTAANNSLDCTTASSGSSDNENSLNHIEPTHNSASFSSPSPDHYHNHDANISHVMYRGGANSNSSNNNRNQASQAYHRHRHSATNGSISSISSSLSRHRLSLTSSSFLGSPRSDRTIDWFRVKMLSYKSDARPGTFFARDNICQFILWCRSLNIIDCLLFETDDLVARKNEKSFILCLLEVARIGFKVGMPTPLIIQLEQEIDREIENDAKLQKQLESAEKKVGGGGDNGSGIQSDDSEDHLSYLQSQDCCESSNNNDENSDKDNFSSSGIPYEKPLELNNNQLDTATGDHSPTATDTTTTTTTTENIESVTTHEDKEVEYSEEDFGPKPQVITNDLLSLHERVVQLLCQCTCATQFPMVRIGDGKYKVGDKLIIFVRILRRHIMVRVGGGWQELSEFLRQKDPCRTKCHHASGKITPTSPPLVSLPSPHTLLASTNNTTSIPVSRSRLVGSSYQLNKGYSNYRNVGSNGSGNNNAIGQKLISGSASMGWLSHNT